MRHLALVVAAFALAAACLSAPAQAQGLPCDAFIKNADGSWQATRNVRVPAAGGAYNVLQGAVFAPTMSFMGLNLAGQLEHDCPGVLVAQPQVDLSTYADPKGEIDAEKLTCGQLVATSQEDADFLGAWYIGWHNALAKKHAIDVAAAKAAIPNLIGYCKANKDRPVAQAIDVVLKKEQR